MASAGQRYWERHAKNYDRSMALLGRPMGRVVDLTREAVAGAGCIRGDVRDQAVVAGAMRDLSPHAVIHVAGIKSVAESMVHPERYFSINTAGTLAVLEAMAATGVRHIIFSSSAAVYGSPADVPVKEQAGTEPESPYGESKLQAERWLTWFQRSHRISYFALRYFNAAGASGNGRFGESWTGAVNLIPVAMRALKSGEQMSIFGDDWPTPDGTAIRDYVHVDDLAEGHVAAVEALLAGRPSAVLNLGTGMGTSVREVLDAIHRLTGWRVPVTIAPRRSGDVPAMWADVSRARETLDWTTHRTLDDIVASAWHFYSTLRAG